MELINWDFVWYTLKSMCLLHTASVYSVTTQIAALKRRLSNQKKEILKLFLQMDQ